MSSSPSPSLVSSVPQPSIESCSKDELLSDPDGTLDPDSNSSSDTTIQDSASPGSTATSVTPTTSSGGRKRESESPSEEGPSKRHQPSSPGSSNQNPFGLRLSAAEEEWHWEKANSGASNEAIDQIMDLIGLEGLKEQVLAIKAKADIYAHQGAELKKERFNMVFQGNPGTGKTTVARMFPEFLQSIEAIDSSEIVEISGTELAHKGPLHVKDIIDTLLGGEDGEGVLFVDEAYQLTAPHVSTSGRQALDIILTEMEKNIGKLVVIFAGYKKDMESFFAHNAGLASRIPYTLEFSDFTDGELWKILKNLIERKYKSKMKVQGGMDGLYMRIAVRRIACSRGVRGFGNARSMENLLQKICDRQVKRLARETKQGKVPDYLYLTQEDLIGPDPSQAKFQSVAWAKLQELIGLDQVKESVRAMIDNIEFNFKRELAEKSPFNFSLNRIFTGSPGTGKTTVAKLYGQIMADLGLLSNGEVLIKNPSEFIGDCLGKSEANTRALLQSAVGKVLVIDEAYMLDPGETSKQSDSYKTGVLDTITAEIQGVPGDDRCILLLGYQDRLDSMLQNANQGFSRRFDTDHPFHFEDFSLVELEQILLLKMKQQDINATTPALDAAREILDRARMRPNFSNGGDVDVLLSNAKKNYQKRRQQQMVSSADYVFDESLEPQDFDPDYRRNVRVAASCLDSLHGLVHESIIARLNGYYQQIRALKACNINFRQDNRIPTLFSFSGPPGTGKSTTARMMAKLYYEMGFLSSTDLIECSATEMIGQYVGQTCPKTERLLERSRGKVLFIDEASRLFDGSFAAESINELTYRLRQPKYSGQIIVILAGHTKEMNRLMATHPTLSTLFNEEILFSSLEPRDCLSLLRRELTEAQIEASFLQDTSAIYPKLAKKFQILSNLPCWSNANDVKTLAKKLKSIALQAMLENQEEGLALQILTAEDTLLCIDEMIHLKRQRQRNQEGEPLGHSAISGKAGRHFSGNSASVNQDMKFRFDALTAVPATTTVNKTTQNALHRLQTAAPFPGERGTSSDITPDAEGHAPVSTRGSSNCNEKAKTATNEPSARTIANILRKLTDHLPVVEESPGEGRQLDTTKNIVTEDKIQEALAKLGKCVNGYTWNKVSGGYKCSGGMHFVSDKQLAEQLGA